MAKPIINSQIKKNKLGENLATYITKSYFFLYLMMSYKSVRKTTQKNGQRLLTIQRR